MTASPVTFVVGDNDRTRENYLDDLLRRHAAAGGTALVITTPTSSLADLAFWPGVLLATTPAGLDAHHDVGLVVIDELSAVWATTKEHTPKRHALCAALDDLTCAAIAGELRLVLGQRHYPPGTLTTSRHVGVELALPPVASLTGRWES